MSPSSSERPPTTPESHPERARDGSPRVSVATKMEFEVPRLLALAKSAGGAARTGAREAQSRPNRSPVELEPTWGVRESWARSFDATFDQSAQQPSPAPTENTRPGMTGLPGPTAELPLRASPVGGVSYIVGEVPDRPFARTEPLHRPARELPCVGTDSGVVSLQTKRPSEPVLDVPRVSAPKAAASSVERATESVDMRAFLAHEVPLPELGKGAESSSRWQSQAETPARGAVSEPRSSARSEPEPAPARKPLQLRTHGLTPGHHEHDAARLERALRPKPPSRVLLYAGCALALALLGASFVFQPKPGSALSPSAPVEAPSAAKSKSVPLPAAAAATSNTPTSGPTPPAIMVKDSVKELAPSAVRKPAVSHHERGGATPASAAALYLQGQYKEALAEYRLLASENPEQTIYMEFARVLKRKLFDTCVRTQPNRREQCKQL